MFPGYVPAKEVLRSRVAAEALPSLDTPHKCRDNYRPLELTQALFRLWILRSRQHPRPCNRPQDSISTSVVEELIPQQNVHEEEVEEVDQRPHETIQPVGEQL